MADIVFLLGAGASHQAGAPLMANFLDVAEDLWKTGRAAHREDSYRAVFSSIGRMQLVHSKAQLDLNNIESVFNAFEMARILGKFPGGDSVPIETAIEALKTVIACTLEQTVSFHFDSQRLLPPKPYERFAELLNHLRSRTHPQRSVAVLTFNYDLAADYGLAFGNLGPEYGLGQDRGSGVPLLKLHGSINWAICDVCNAVVPWYFKDFFSRFQFHPFDGPVRLDLWSKFGSFAHCEKKVRCLPFLVPPSWNKTDRHETIRPVWQRAAQELTTAENVFVIGYSLPQTDGFFRTLYALGVVGEMPLKRIWVFNPDETGEVENRFRSLVGPGAAARFRYFPMQFAAAIDLIRNEFPERR